MRITQILRNATISNSKSVAQDLIKDLSNTRTRIDGLLIIGRYYDADDNNKIKSILGIEYKPASGDGTTTLLATQEDLSEISSQLSGNINQRLDVIAKTLGSDLSGNDKGLVGLTKTTQTINGVTIEKYTLSLAGTNYISSSNTIVDALKALDSALYTLSLNAITNIQKGTNDKLISDITTANNTTTITTTASLVKITTAANSEYAAQYKLVGSDGTTALGATINIPRDLVIKDAWLSATENGDAIAASDTTTKAGYIVFEIFTGASSTATTRVSVNIGRFLEELEASDIANSIEGDGLVYNTTTKKLDVNVGNGIEKASDKIRLKLDSTTDGHLTLSANGLKLTAFTGADVLLTGFTESTETSSANLALAATDSVNLALAKLYRTIELDEEVKAAALTDLDDRVTVLENATLTAGNGIDTTNNVISVVLDENATGKGTSATTHNQYASNNWNALELSSDGLYLSSIWDCGTY